MNNKIEIWKSIKGFEGRYDVSNFGNVKSLHAYNKCNYPLILKGRKTKKGYLRVNLGFGVDRYIHRLVAQHFIDNPNNFDQVNHIDFDKSNNHVENLEWCNSSHNMKHARDGGRIVFSDECRKIISDKRKQYWKNKKSNQIK